MHPRRRRPAHPALLRRDRLIVFVTVCAAQRKPIRANAQAVATIRAAWREADGWAIGRYVVMPDHIHLFCAPNHEHISLRQWLRYWRSLSSRRWPCPAQQPIWQPDVWDTQLRTGDSYEGKWEYVRNNPVRHGLVEAASAWPFAGEIEILDWD